MHRIHQNLLRGGSLSVVQNARPVEELCWDTPSAQYPRHGIHPAFASDLHTALHKLADQEALETREPVAEIFQKLLRGPVLLDRVRRRSLETIHFLALAAHYGIWFGSTQDLEGSVIALHEHMAPEVCKQPTHVHRQLYWQWIGDLFALLGEVVPEEPKFQELREHVQTGTIKNTATLLSILARPLPGNKLLALSVLCERAGVNAEQLATLLNLSGHGRVDDLIQLLSTRLLTDRALEAFIQEPRLLAALSLRALDELLTIAPDTDMSILDLAREFAQDMHAANALACSDLDPEPEPQTENVLVVDHTRLDIGEQVGSRTGRALEAIQILLVHGVIQPHRDTSSILNGSEIPREELEGNCNPHITRAGISETVFEQALTFLTTIRVLVTRSKGGRTTGDPRLRSRRIRFDRTVSGNPRAEEIVRRVLALNRELRG